jgi:hypothetical protein
MRTTSPERVEIWSRDTAGAESRVSPRAPGSRLRATSMRAAILLVATSVLFSLSIRESSAQHSGPPLRLASTIPGVVVYDGIFTREMFITDSGADRYPAYVAVIRRCGLLHVPSGISDAADEHFTMLKLQDRTWFPRHLKCVNAADFPVILTSREYSYLTAPLGAMPDGKAPGAAPSTTTPRK